VLGVLPCHTGGAGEKVAGVLRWTKKVSRCVIGKKRKRDRKKEKRPIGRKGSLLEKKKKGVKKGKREK
jgi:hypothetical protein